MELAELEVRELGPGRVCEDGSGADRAPWVGGPLPQGRAASGREHGRPSRDRPGVGDHSGADGAVAPQGERRGLLQDVNAPVGSDQLGEAASDRAAGLGAPGVHNPARRVSPFERQRESGCVVGHLAPGLGIEANAALAKFGHRRWGFAGQRFDRCGATEPAAGVERVRGVARRGVVGRERRGQASLGPVARALGEGLSRDQGHLGAVLGRAQGDVESRRPAADHRDVGLNRGSVPVRWAGHRQRLGTVSGVVGLYLSHPSSLEHDTGAHPENASRLRAIEAKLDDAGWPGLQRIEAPAATREQLARVHTPEHIDAIQEFSARGGGMIDIDTIASEGSFDAALHAAGGAVNAVERLLAGEDTFAFCGLRPPGHHAEAARAMGFCLFNNVAVASAHATHAGGAERVLVLDWDVHHGNGTEAIFAASHEVLYASIHQWPLYPGTGAAEYMGKGAGEGFTVNLPVPPGAGSTEFLSLVQHVVAPIGREFSPGLVAISAGYDAHRDDPLAECSVDTAGYADMSATMRDLAADLDVPVLVCLEGGYAPGALADSVLATVDALGSDREPPAAPVEPAKGFAERHRGRWPALSA